MKLHLRADLAAFAAFCSIVFLMATSCAPFMNGYRGAVFSSAYLTLAYAWFTRTLARDEAVAAFSVPAATATASEPGMYLVASTGSGALVTTSRDRAKLRLASTVSNPGPLKWANTSGEHA